MEVTDRLMAAWWTAAFLVVLGMALSVFWIFASAPGLLALAATAGVTAARGHRAGRWWLVLAWSVPVLPGVVALAVFTWLARIGADPLAVVLLVYLTVPLWTGVAVVFLVAAAAELVRLHLRRRRRFAAPGPAWENGPPPPSYS